MPTLDIDQLIKLLTDEADKAGSQVALAKRLNVSAPYLSDVLNRRRDPGEAILEPLGLRRVVVYERIQKGKATATPPHLPTGGGAHKPKETK